MVDYITTYMTKDGFDFPRLVNDDFINAIRLLYNQGHYVSAAKLLMSFVDTIAFVEHGDTTIIPFRHWLDAYVDLASVGVTSEELWEHRNSLLHMSNLDSRKVLAGKVRRLWIYVGRQPPASVPQDNEGKWYNLLALIKAVGAGIGRFAASYNTDRAKFEVFLDRYDLIVSDKRVRRINLEEPSEPAA